MGSSAWSATKRLVRPSAQRARMAAAAAASCLMLAGTLVPPTALAQASPSELVGVDLQVLGAQLSGSVTMPGGQEAAAPPPALPLAEPTDPESFDERLARVARAIPTFGGFFIDAEKDQLLLYMTNGDSRAASINSPAVARVKRLIQRLFDVTQRQTKVLDADYGFLRLKRWQLRLTRALTMPGIVLTDVDDDDNRVTIGAESDDVMKAVAAKLRTLRIPRQAVRITKMLPRVDLTSIRDRHRPLMGGLQITTCTGTSSDPCQGGGACTLGLAVTSRNLSRPGFLTNSHCTNTQGGVEATPFVQPASGKRFLGRPGTNINDAGTEALDPPYVQRSGCPGPCRFSDSAFVQFPRWWTDSGYGFYPGHWIEGTIAKVPLEATVQYAGSSYTSSNYYRPPENEWYVVAAQDPPVGRPLTKVGITTGRTFGKVTRTCATIPKQGGRWLLCNNEASLVSRRGDSGSPMFDGSGREGYVHLLGLLWGGDLKTVTSFSPPSGLRTDLGGLYLCKVLSADPAGNCY